MLIAGMSGAEELVRKRMVRRRPLPQAKPPPREVGMLDERPGLMPARHDRAALGLEEGERRARLDHLLEDDAAAPRHGRERAQDEAAAPEEREVSPPGIVRRDAEARGDAAGRRHERGVRMYHRLGARRRPRREEDGREVGRRDERFEPVEEGVVGARRQRRPAFRAGGLALEQHDATEGRRTRREEPAGRDAVELGDDVAERGQVVVPEESGQRHQELHVAMRERIGDLVALPERREGDEERADAECAEGDGQPLEPVRAEEADARALADARRDEPPRRFAALAPELRPREPRRHAVRRRVGDDFPRPVCGCERVEKGPQRLHRGTRK